jgi:hypothetical protein
MPLLEPGLPANQPAWCNRHKALSFFAGKPRSNRTLYFLKPKKPLTTEVDRGFLLRLEAARITGRQRREGIRRGRFFPR